MGNFLKFLTEAKEEGQKSKLNILTAINHSKDSVRENAVERRFDEIPEEHYETLLTDPNNQVRSLAALKILKNNNVSDHHLSLMATDTNNYVRRSLAGSRHLSPELASYLVKSDNGPYVKYEALNNHNVKSDQVEQLMPHFINDEKYIHLFGNPNISTSQYEKILDRVKKIPFNNNEREEYGYKPENDKFTDHSQPIYNDYGARRDIPSVITTKIVSSKIDKDIPFDKGMKEIMSHNYDYGGSLSNSRVEWETRDQLHRAIDNTHSTDDSTTSILLKALDTNKHLANKETVQKIMTTPAMIKSAFSGLYSGRGYDHKRETEKRSHQNIIQDILKNG